MRKCPFSAFVCTMLISLPLVSCAYMQSHKKLLEYRSEHIGCELTTSNLSLYSANGKWYIGAPKSKIKRDHPLIYDTIYGEETDNAPVEKAIPGTEQGLLYIPVSTGTATVLQRPDGYADLQALIMESLSSNRPAIESLPGATRHPILATIENKAEGTTCYIHKTEPVKPTTLTTVLCTLDKYTIDAAGTLAYNVSLPFTAPFRFFWQFLSDNT